MPFLVRADVLGTVSKFPHLSMERNCSMQCRISPLVSKRKTGSLKAWTTAFMRHCNNSLLKYFILHPSITSNVIFLWQECSNFFHPEWRLSSFLDKWQKSQFFYGYESVKPYQKETHVGGKKRKKRSIKYLFCKCSKELMNFILRHIGGKDLQMTASPTYMDLAQLQPTNSSRSSWMWGGRTEVRRVQTRMRGMRALFSPSIILVTAFGKGVWSSLSAFNSKPKATWGAGEKNATCWGGGERAG